MSAPPATAGRRALIARVNGWLTREGVARRFAIALAAAAVLSGLSTYGAMSGAGPFKANPRTVLILLNVDLVLLLLLGGVVAHRLVRLWLERRRGSAGSRLQSRLVALFGVVAITPAILVSIFSALFLDLGLQAWFSQQVRTALTGPNGSFIISGLLETDYRLDVMDLAAPPESQTLATREGVAAGTTDVEIAVSR